MYSITTVSYTRGVMHNKDVALGSNIILILGRCAMLLYA